MESGIVKTSEEAVKKLFEDHLIPFHEKISPHNWRFN